VTELKLSPGLVGALEAYTLFLLTLGKLLVLVLAMRMHDRSRANPVQIKVGLARRTTVRFTKIMVLLKWQKKKKTIKQPHHAMLSSSTNLNFPGNPPEAVRRSLDPFRKLTGF
jgi:hypothetical protein